MSHAPIVLEQMGDRFIEACQVAAIVWEGATSAGDVVEVRLIGSDALLWRGRTNAVHTYLGANIGPEGVSAVKGFYAARVDNGQMLVYLKEQF